MGLDIFISERDKKTRDIVSQDFLYYRKSNFLFAYFQNVANKVKYDQIYTCTISKEELEDIADRCEKIINNHTLAEELLPTMEGFFFGSTDYDEMYFDKIEEVYIDFKHILASQFDFDNYELVIDFNY